MTTQAFLTIIDQTTDSGFRVWAQELSNALVAAGLVRTSDTGQINFTTVTIPAVNTAAGYEIMRFNDSLQGTAPIFIKIEYGSASGGTTFPSLWITVGTGSNGSGTLTGVVTARVNVSINYALNSTTTVYKSYICVTEGNMYVAWKLGSSYGEVGRAFFAVVRTHNTSGAPTAEGYVFIHSHTISQSLIFFRSVRTAYPGVVYAPTTSFCLIPGFVATSVVDEVHPQVYANFAISPQTWKLPTLGAVLLTEIPAGTTFSVALVGTTPRTLLPIGYYGFNVSAAFTGPGTVANYCLAMLWE